jgi:hypothetical protein
MKYDCEHEENEVEIVHADSDDNDEEFLDGGKMSYTFLSIRTRPFGRGYCSCSV